MMVMINNSNNEDGNTDKGELCFYLLVCTLHGLGPLTCFESELTSEIVNRLNNFGKDSLNGVLVHLKASTYTEQRNKENAEIYPCLERDWKPRAKRPLDRPYFLNQENPSVASQERKLVISSRIRQFSMRIGLKVLFPASLVDFPLVTGWFLSSTASNEMKGSGCDFF
jgi:hypothetical protein